MSESPLSIKKNIAWNTAGQFIYLFSQWLLTFCVVQLLGVEAVGVFSLAIAIAGAFIGISLYGVRSFQVSDVNDKYSSQVYRIARIITSVLALIICAVFVLFNDYSAYITVCILVYMAFKISESVSDVYQGFFQKAMRMDYIGRSFMIKGIVILAAFVITILLTEDLLAGIVVLCITSCVVIVFYDMRKSKKFTLPKAKTNWLAPTKSLLLECLPLAIFVSIFNILTQIPRYFIEIQMGMEALGFYATIAMPVVIIQVSASFIFAPLTTPFAQHLDKGDLTGFKRLLGKTVLFIAALSVVSALAFGLVGEWLLVLLFGAMIEPYVFLLMPLVACTIVVAVSWLLSTVLIVLRKQKMILLASVFSLVIVLLGSIPLINLFEQNGASFVLIIALAFYCLFCTVILMKSIKDRQKLIP
ncbi:MAG: oligosaccharide flippase family protein [Coriobacteriia bacterium]|nr:oligosaccharide flippase family protein [Coriobacteriia bacterium]